MKGILFMLLSILCFQLDKYCCCDEIKVDLFSYLPGNNSVYKQYTTVSDDKTKVKIKNIQVDVGFFIIQVHSFMENVTLSYNSSILMHSHVTGTNIGLIYNHENSVEQATFYIFRNIKIKKDAQILLIITVYDYLDPVPGGCNLTFNNKISPYQLISYTKDYIEVESQPPSASGVSCDENTIQVDMYHLFLKEYNNDIQTYFAGIEKMASVESIKRYGIKIRSADGYYKYHRMYSSYRGTGEVFAIVATFNNRSSAYVSAISYGCDLMNWHDCVTPVSEYWKFICATLLIGGLIICFLGHRFFRFTLFLVGFAFGILVTYLAVSFDGHFGADEKIVTSVITGFFYGVIWVFIWWKFGIPLLSVHLNFILAGFILASVVFYAGLADIGVFTNNVNYWVTFACLILVCILISTPATMYGHIFGCSFLGAYACIVALNYYLGGNLQYIILNTFRRATVTNFNMAIVDPPFQIADILHSLLWAFLVVVGCYVQLRGQRGKSPFPPHRNGVVLANRVSERSPLIRPENVAAPQHV